jgi:basic membrane protein A and related proteins
MGRLLDDGTRVVFQAAGPAGADAIAVAADRDRFVIGVDVDQAALAPDVVIASIRLRADIAATRFMRAAGNGEIEGGIYEFGVADGAIDLIYNPVLEGVVPASARDRLDQAIEAIRSGDLRMETQP